VATIHISEAEAIRGFPGLLARAQMGVEIVVELESAPSIILRKAAEPRGRLHSESIALAEAHARATGSEPVMDVEFVADLEEKPEL